jgi:hypothetical protein
MCTCQFGPLWSVPSSEANLPNPEILPLFAKYAPSNKRPTRWKRERHLSKSASASQQWAWSLPVLLNGRALIAAATTYRGLPPLPRASIAHPSSDPTILFAMARANGRVSVSQNADGPSPDLLSVEVSAKRPNRCPVVWGGEGGVQLIASVSRRIGLYDR